MKTIHLKLYCLNELEADAREKALDHYRDLNTCFDWYNFLFDDFAAVCKTLGISVDTKSIHFSGFYSQGDGSAFEATAYLPALAEGIEKQAWRDYAPQLELDLPSCPTDRRVLKLMESEALDLSPRIRQPNRSYYVSAELNEQLPWNNHKRDRIEAELEKTENWLSEVAVQLNRYLYGNLQDEYEYQTADEQVAATIEANDYHFTADGKTANRLERMAEPIHH